MGWPVLKDFANGIFVVNEIMIGEFLNSLVINLVSLPAHFLSFFSCVPVNLALLMSRVEELFVVQDLSYGIIFLCFPGFAQWVLVHSVTHIMYRSMFMSLGMARFVGYYDICCGLLPIYTEGEIFCVLMYYEV